AFGPLSTEGLIKFSPVRFHHALGHQLGVSAWDERKRTSRRLKPYSIRKSESGTSGPRHTSTMANVVMVVRGSGSMADGRPQRICGAGSNTFRPRRTIKALK